MKNAITIIILIFATTSIVSAQFWSGTDGTDTEIFRTGYTGIGVSSPAFILDVHEKLGVDGYQVLYLPDQNVFTNSIVLGSGGTNLQYISGYDGTGNVFVDAAQVGKNIYDPL